MCNSFFVDLVSTMCFKDNTPPQKSVIDTLLSLLFVQKELLRDASQSEFPSPHEGENQSLCSALSHDTNYSPLLSLAAEHREHTKSLSPFDDVVDKTPVIRSVVLKLLLKYRSVVRILVS